MSVSPAPPIYCGLDVSTQSLTAILVDADDRIYHVETVVYDEHFSKMWRVRRGVCLPSAGHPFPAHDECLSPSMMFVAALDTVFARMHASVTLRPLLQRLVGLGVSGQQHGTVYWRDPTALSRALPSSPLLPQLQDVLLSIPLGPIWQDASTEPVCRGAEFVAGCWQAGRDPGLLARASFTAHPHTSQSNTGTPHHPDDPPPVAPLFARLYACMRCLVPSLPSHCSAGLVARLLRAGADCFFRRSGSRAFERFSSMQLVKFMHTRPRTQLARTTRVSLVSSFVTSLLQAGAPNATVVPVDASDGSGVNLMNLQSGRWDPLLAFSVALAARVHYGRDQQRTVGDGSASSKSRCEECERRHPYTGKALLGEHEQPHCRAQLHRVKQPDCKADRERPGSKGELCDLEGQCDGTLGASTAPQLRHAVLQAMTDAQQCLRWLGAPESRSTAPVGSLGPHFLRRYGVGAAARRPPLLALGSGDNPCSLQGLRLQRPGDVGVSLGTSDTCFALHRAASWGGMPTQAPASTSGITDASTSSSMSVPSKLTPPASRTDPTALTAHSDPSTAQFRHGHVLASPVWHCDDSKNTQLLMSMTCVKNGALARERVKGTRCGWDGFSQMLRDTPPGNQGLFGVFLYQPEIVPHVPNPAGARFFRWTARRLASGANKRRAGPRQLRELTKDEVSQLSHAQRVRACVEWQALNMRMHSRQLMAEEHSDAVSVVALRESASDDPSCAVHPSLHKLVRFLEDADQSCADHSGVGGSVNSSDCIRPVGSSDDCAGSPNVQATDMHGGDSTATHMQRADKTQDIISDGDKHLAERKDVKARHDSNMTGGVEGPLGGGSAGRGRVFVCGGASRNRAICQVLADVFQRPVCASVLVTEDCGSQPPSPEKHDHLAVPRSVLDHLPSDTTERVCGTIELKNTETKRTICQSEPTIMADIAAFGAALRAKLAVGHALGDASLLKPSVDCDTQPTPSAPSQRLEVRVVCVPDVATKAVYAEMEKTLQVVERDFLQ